LKAALLQQCCDAGLLATGIVCLCRGGGVVVYESQVFVLKTRQLYLFIYQFHLGDCELCVTPMFGFGSCIRSISAFNIKRKRKLAQLGLGKVWDFS